MCSDEPDGNRLAPMSSNESGGQDGMAQVPPATALVQRLRDKGQLPALDANITDICKLAQAPQTSTIDLASVILRDCSLTSSVIASANSALYHPSEPIKTVSTAILVMGFETVKNISMGLGILKQISHCAKDRNLYRLFACSYFTGLLAMAIGQKSGHESLEELRVAGVLSELPRLILANAFPQEYTQMQQRVLRERISLTAACQETFGAGYDDLTQEISRYWSMPANVVRCIQPDNRADPLPAVVRRAGRLSGMLFGNAPSGEAPLGALEKELQTLFKEPDFRLADFIQQAAANDPNVGRFFRLNGKDVEMMVRIAEWGKVNPAEVASMLSFGTATQELEDKPREDPALLVGQYLTDLALNIRRSAEINRTLMVGLEGLYRCTQPCSVVLAFLDAQKRQLEGRFTMGVSMPPGSGDYRALISTPGSPVAQCWTSRELVRVKPGTPMEWAPGRRLDMDSVLLAPIMARGVPIGQCLLGRKGAPPFTAQEASWMEAFIGHIGLAFERCKPAA